MQRLELRPGQVRKTRMCIGMGVSLFVHVVVTCLSLGNPIPPSNQDRQRGTTAINLRCIAMPPEFESAGETVISVLAMPALLPSDELPLPPFPSLSPLPKERQSSVSVTAERDSQPEPQLAIALVASVLSSRRAPPPRLPSTQSVDVQKVSRQQFPPTQAAVTKVESIADAAQKAVVSQQLSGVEVPPNFSRRPEPIYPPELLVDGIEGSVQLLVRVGTNGTPVSVSVHRSSGFRQMDRSAVEAVTTWEFSPARIGTIPVAKDVIVPVHFRIRR